jgi:hypothetical protein
VLQKVKYSKAGGKSEAGGCLSEVFEYLDVMRDVGGERSGCVCIVKSS